MFTSIAVTSLIKNVRIRLKKIRLPSTVGFYFQYLSTDVDTSTIDHCNNRVLVEWREGS